MAEFQLLTWVPAVASDHHRRDPMIGPYGLIDPMRGPHGRLSSLLGWFTAAFDAGRALPDADAPDVPLVVPVSSFPQGRWSPSVRR
jgi:hypothetical protein